MKASILFLFLSLALIVNANDAINYQAVIRSSDGKVVSSKSIAVQMTIFNDIQSQNMVYKENHATETNEFGMINLKIGLGQSIFGVFDNINWSTGTFYVQVAVDFSGGNNFEIIGISQLLSVPYALYAKKSGDLNVANMSDAFVKELAEKLGITKPAVIDAKVSNPDYSPIAETKDIVVYQTNNALGIDAVLGNIAINKISYSQFKISENGIDGTFNTTVNLTPTNFPNILNGGTSFEKIILVPWVRNANTPNKKTGWRCIVFTIKGQIYHNFPNRTPAPGYPDGVEQPGDINKWDESVVWDLPTRRLPSKTSNTFPYSLNPCLPSTCYDLSPLLNNDNGYGHGGFQAYKTELVTGKSIQFPRFYFHNRDSKSNPVNYMGGLEISDKIQIIGTYRSNTSFETTSRICVFATTDGGRQWFNKYEFANNMPGAVGNALIGKYTSNNYISNTFSIQKRNTIYPTAINKEPIDNFSYGNDISIQSIINSDSLILNTITPHGLVTGDLIVVKKTQLSTSSNFDFLCNDNINTKNGGNGKIWRVQVITANSIKLYEYVHNSDSNIPARHIHAINHVKDGYIISTGEVYPQGWFLYMQLKTNSEDSTVNAYDEFNFLRLNSSKTGIQRSLGTIMIDDVDQTIVFASDEAEIIGSIYNLNGRTNTSFSRSSTGVFKGKLADIDDFSKFKCIYEAQQVAYHFKEVNGMWVFAGSQGELAISIDKGETWRKFIVSGNVLAQQFPKGVDILGRYYLDKVIIYRK